MMILDLFNSIFGNLYVSVATTIGSLGVKLYLILLLIIYILKSRGSKKLLFLTLFFFTGTFLRDSVYLIYFSRKILNYNAEYFLLTFISRINLAFFLAQYYSLVLILNHLIKYKPKWSLLNSLYIFVNGSISLVFIYLAVFRANIASNSIDTFYFEISLVYLTYISVIFLLLPVFFKIFIYVKFSYLPKILVRQIIVFSSFITIDLLVDFITEKNLYRLFIAKIILLDRYILLNISTLVITYALYYSAKLMVGLRYMNLETHVQSNKKFKFISDFKEILEKLSYVTSVKELAHITQMFFNAAFNVSIGSTQFYTRDPEIEYPEEKQIALYIEDFLLYHQDLLKSRKIFIKDEIEFTNFYQTSEEGTQIAQFLDKIDADIFLPIYELRNIVAYIIVKTNSRKSSLFNEAERDEMLVFTNYLSNIINILKNNNLERLLLKEKELQEELYLKHQEVNQYKESLRYFLNSHKNRKTGLLFYKNNRFSNINKDVQEITGLDILLSPKHPIVLALKKVAIAVLEYKTTQTGFGLSKDGKKLLFTGILDPIHNSVILMISYPEIAAMIQSQYNNIKDPSRWDYLLYLETTESGRLINQLLPSNSESILDLKLDLLSTALSKKATLLNIVEEDLMPVVTLLHHISLRKTLHVINISVPEKANEIALKLFGINPLLDRSDNNIGVLEKLDNIGTIFIQNIQLLNIVTQDKLAEFISSGFFYKIKSDHKVFSNVRVICSSSKNLQKMAAENLFSKKLFNELNKMSLNIPSLSFVSDQEIVELAYGFSGQIIKPDKFDLNNKDIEKILGQRPISLVELKNRVNGLLTHKFNKANPLSPAGIDIHNTNFDLAFHIDEPEISQAIKLGKRALKDSNIMSLLWGKYKNQNKIAQLLGVNRSSINRRFQQYNLIEKA